MSLFFRHQVLARTALCFGIFAHFAFAPFPSTAVTSRSVNYTVEYAVTAAGGGNSESAGGDYSIVSLVTVENSGTPASSDTYSVESILAPPLDGTSSIGDWMLY